MVFEIHDKSSKCSRVFSGRLRFHGGVLSFEEPLIAASRMLPSWNSAVRHGQQSTSRQAALGSTLSSRRWLASCERAMKDSKIQLPVLTGSCKACESRRAGQTPDSSLSFDETSTGPGTDGKDAEQFRRRKGFVRWSRGR